MRKRKGAAVLCLLLLLTGCGVQASGTEEAGDSEVPLQDAPVAQVEGETVSPDGRFEVRTEGKSGQYVSGIQPPEFLQVVDRETGEVLWQDMGWRSQSALWSPDGAYVALAYSARTWNAVTFLEADTWTAWEFTLPGGEPIPEYEFFPENWGLWRSDNSLDLTVGDGDGHPPHTYNCVLSMKGNALTGDTREITKEVLSETCDFNRDGVPETAERTTVWFPGFTGGAVEAYELRLLDETGGVLWEDTAGTSHAGQNSVYACRVDGADCLLRYNPYINQGIASYSYELFFLDGEGKEQILDSGEVRFSAGSPMLDTVGFDPEAIAVFLETVHGYIDSGVCFMDTTPGADPPYPDGYDKSLSLRENLERYQAYIEAGHP